MCSRELIYYFAINSATYYEYKNNLLSNQHLLQLQYMAAALIDLLVPPTRDYTYDATCDTSKPLALNRRGELVVAYYDAQNINADVNYDMAGKLGDTKWNSPSIQQTSYKPISNIYDDHNSNIYSILDLLAKNIGHPDGLNNGPPLCGKSSMDYDYYSSRSFFDIAKEMGDVGGRKQNNEHVGKKLSAIGCKSKSLNKNFTIGPTVECVKNVSECGDKLPTALGDFENTSNLADKKNNNSPKAVTMPHRLYADVV